MIPTRRSRATLAALVLLPVGGNVLLAALLFSQVGALPGGDQADSLPPVPVRESRAPSGSLPRSEFTDIIAFVERTTGHPYTCDGPWGVGVRLVTWSCRTRDALVILTGRSRTQIFSIEATWFGFDPRTTDLPTWAAAAQRSDELGAESGTWVAGHVGQFAESTLGGTTARVGGARGAMTLQVIAL